MTLREGDCICSDFHCHRVHSLCRARLGAAEHPAKQLSKGAFQMVGARDQGCKRPTLAKEAVLLQIDERTYQNCRVMGEREFLAECGVDTSLDTFPIPVMPLSALPNVERIINASQAALRDLQQRYHRVITLG